MQTQSYMALCPYSDIHGPLYLTGAQRMLDERTQHDKPELLCMRPPAAVYGLFRAGAGLLIFASPKMARWLRTVASVSLPASGS